MENQYAQMLINELRRIVSELQNLNRNVSDVASQIRRK